MPKIYDVQHGSAEWESLRVGRPTSSEFDRIITTTGRPSTQAEEYALKLVAEIILKRPIMSLQTPWMERGVIMEEEAARAYSFITGKFPKRAGFVTDDLGYYGCSPDRLIEDDGLLEIKVPSEIGQMRYLWNKKISKDYYPQLQGQLFITERKWVDIFGFHPELPPAIIRVARDEEFIEKLKIRLEKFRELMGEMLLEFQDRGLFEVPENTILDAG